MRQAKSCLIGSIDPNKPITIIGGGFAGLSMGFFLKKHGIPFRLFEKSPQIGGLIGSITSEFGTAEKAAHAFFMSESMLEDISELNLTPIYAQKKLQKKIYRNGRFQKNGMSRIELAKIGFNFLTKPPPRYSEDMTLAEFLEPLAPLQIQHEVFAAAMVGVYAADSQNLHLQSLFPNVDFKSVFTYRDFFKQIKKSKNGQRFQSISFKNGMQELVSSLGEYLTTDIETGFEMQEAPDNSIICTNSHQAAKLLEKSSPQLSEQLALIEYLPVSAVTIFSQAEISDLKNSFGCLFSPRSYQGKIRGILSNWEIFPAQMQQKTHHSYTFIMHGISKLESHLENELKSLGLEDIWNQQLNLEVVPWKMGLPLYNYQRFKTVQKLKENEPSNIALFGNYIGGISLREMFKSAKAFAEECSRERS